MLLVLRSIVRSRSSLRWHGHEHTSVWNRGHYILGRREKVVSRSSIGMKFHRMQIAIRSLLLKTHVYERCMLTENSFSSIAHTITQTITVNRIETIEPAYPHVHNIHLRCLWISRRRMCVIARSREKATSTAVKL